MKRVFTSESPGDVHYLKNMLEQAGIACIIRNEQLIGGVGELPFLEAVPELWVLNARDVGHAVELIEERHRSEPAHVPPWRCRHCREQNEGQFALCWNCGEPDERDE